MEVTKPDSLHIPQQSMAGNDKSFLPKFSVLPSPLQQFQHSIEYASIYQKSCPIIYNNTNDKDSPMDEQNDFDDIYEYDVKEKLQTLNAQLASEPYSPTLEFRNSKVVFKDDVVSLVVPPQYFETSESELDDISFNIDTNKVTASGDQSTLMLPSERPTLESTTNTEQITKEEDYRILNEGDYSNYGSVVDPPPKSAPLENSSKDMVVSRGGNFQFLSSEEITNESRRNIKVDNDMKKRHSQRRTISAQPSKRNRDQVLNYESSVSIRSYSNLRSSSTLEKPNEGSKYHVPRVDKEALNRQRERKKKQEEELKQKEGEKHNMKKEINDKSYNAWFQSKLKEKKEDEKRKKKEEEEEIERKEKLQVERKLLAQEIETELSKKLTLEKRKEEKMRKYKLKEIEQSANVHTDSERKKAYKDWLKKKQTEHQMKVREERQNARITRQAMRQYRKSQNLAQAIQQCSSLRYLDFLD